MTEIFWQNNEGKKLFAAHWPVANPKAVIALVHGQGEHIGRFKGVAEWFNNKNTALIGFDQQGYGRTEGKRGHAKDLEAYLDDIGLLVSKTKELYPNTPIFLYGHSMGGNFVLNYMLRRDLKVNGVIATSPWIRLAFEAPKLKVMAGRLLRSIVPTLALPTDLDPRSISQDPVEVEAYKNDPLVHSMLSAAAGMEILDAAAWLNSYTGQVPLPTLLVHGGGDKLTSAVATREFAQRVKGDITHHEFPGLYHEMHHEKNRQEVFEFIENWININD